MARRRRPASSIERARLLRLWRELPQEQVREPRRGWTRSCLSARAPHRLAGAGRNLDGWTFRLDKSDLTDTTVHATQACVGFIRCRTSFEVAEVALHASRHARIDSSLPAGHTPGPCGAVPPVGRAQGWRALQSMGCGLPQAAGHIIERHMNEWARQRDVVNTPARCGDWGAGDEQHDCTSNYGHGTSLRPIGTRMHRAMHRTVS